MIQFLVWYLVISLLGALSFPVAYRLFPALPDRGFSLGRVLGLLLWGFNYWILVSFGIIRNEIGGLMVALLPVAGLALWLSATRDESTNRLGWQEYVGWLKSNWRLVVSVEALFLAAFAAWVFVRANNPDISSAGGEKWMEVAFINAILKSPTFPPHDPWLSGYAISYYYFGYILTAMLAMVTNTSGSTAHNLMLPLIFAMSAIGAYGLVYNLLSVYWKTRPMAARVGAFWAPLFLLLLGNLEGFLELLHAYGVGWSGASNFWTWLNIKDINVAPTLPYQWAPRFWFWWRASRVVHDYDLKGNFIEVIDEFPFFSYLLGDLHPHVLAMPFGLLAVALALNLFLGGWQGETKIFGFRIPVQKQGLAISALVLGGLSFLNTWDFPVYLAVVAGAFALWQARKLGWGWDLLENLLKFSIPVGLASILLYLPFYIGFSSQAGGMLPNVIFPTRGVYLWIMFGTLFVPVLCYMIWNIGRREDISPLASHWKIGFGFATGLALLLWLFSILLGYVAGITDAGRAFIESQGFSSFQSILAAATQRRLSYGLGLVTLMVLTGISLAYIFRISSISEEKEDAQSPSGIVALVMLFVFLGGALVLAPEFVYLRDQFGSRMNTVFKFYYQAWTLWSLAASFGFVVMVGEIRTGLAGMRGRLATVFTSIILLVFLMGMVYPVLALPNKTENFNLATPDRRRLDGSLYLRDYMPDDFSAIEWLAEADPGTVAEAVGGSYTEYARISTYSGQPTVLGWPGHEGQWRGGSQEMGNRMEDISRLYTSSEWSEAEAIIEKYKIRYVYIGRLERSTYQVDESKFAANLSQVFQQGEVVIYEVHQTNRK
jgi:YYY domain-containing protein